VNYSSQLIFVSGDSIAQQQRTLEEFLSTQKENTEVSYFTSELSMESPDFRRIICRQLLGQKVGSFVRPLKELLKELHQEPGPFLVCIKQAHTLPNPFLQELWDWVTESKKLDTNHHVNVILFGETAWAEKAKKWLPKRNSSRPVLLSSQSVDSSKFDVNALETLMAEERPKFSLNLFSRDEFSPPVVTQKWFIACVLVLLFSVFIGLMSWQYPEHVKSLLQTGSLPPDKNLDADQLAIINEQLERERESSKETSSAVASEKQSQQQSDNELVTSWGTAKQVSEEKIVILTETNKEQANAAIDAQSNFEIVDPEDVEGDFAVPDIISVEQLDASLGVELLTDQGIENTALVAPKKEVAEPKNSIYEFNEETLLSLPEPSILLQLSGIQNKTVLSDFISDNGLQDLVWVYQTTRYGGPWHVVLFNQRFDSVAAAREAVSLLPQSIQATGPFAKELTQVKLEIRNR
jgi:DamX protein